MEEETTPNRFSSPVSSLTRDSTGNVTGLDEVSTLDPWSRPFLRQTTESSHVTSCPGPDVGPGGREERSTERTFEAQSEPGLRSPPETLYAENQPV